MNGVERIAVERDRQRILWGDDHDDGHDVDHALAWAAVCYAAPKPLERDPWPWGEDYDKRPRDSDGALREPTRTERIRLLEKAGALIAAEIDRMLRDACVTCNGDRFVGQGEHVDACPDCNPEGAAP